MYEIIKKLGKKKLPGPAPVKTVDVFLVGGVVYFFKGLICGKGKIGRCHFSQIEKTFLKKK